MLPSRLSVVRQLSSALLVGSAMEPSVVRKPLGVASQCAACLANQVLVPGIDCNGLLFPGGEWPLGIRRSFERFVLNVLRLLLFNSNYRMSGCSFSSIRVDDSLR